MAGLLRHNYGQRIGHLADAYSCSVPGPQLFTQLHVVRKRKIACRSGDTISPDDNGSIMERRILLKNIDKQLTCQDGINSDPRTLKFCEAVILLYHDQSAGLYSTHIKHSPLKLNDRPVCEPFLNIFLCVKRYQARKKLLLAQLLKHPSEFRLENNDQSDDQYICQIPEQPQDGIHPQNVGDQDKGANSEDSF